MATVSRTEALSLRNTSLYLWATVFTAGNILLPQLCHMVNLGGKAFLPIMFFTLIAAARFGVKCGLLTAVVSPLLSMALFGMPSGIMLGAVIFKSLLIAGVIGFWQYKGYSFNILNIILLVIAYQIIGFAIEGAVFFGYATSWSDLLISWPGALVQMVTLWVVTRRKNIAATAK